MRNPDHSLTADYPASGALPLVHRGSRRTDGDSRSDAQVLTAARVRKIFCDCRRVLLRADDERKAMRETCRIVTASGDYRMAWIGLVEHDQQLNVRPAAHAGVDLQLLSSPGNSWGDNELGQGPVGRAVRSGMIQYVSDMQSEVNYSPWQKAAEAGGYRSFIVFPLKHDARVLGTFSIGAMDRNAFPSEHIGLLSELADDLAFKLTSLRALAEENRNECERRRAVRALGESEERFRALTGLSSDFYWETDEQHRFTMHVSGGGFRSGQPPGFQIGKARWELPYVASDKAGWEAHRAELDAHRPFQDFEFARPRCDGTKAYFSVSGEPVFDSERCFRGYRGVGRDITERKQSEENLRNLMLEQQLLLDNTSVGIAFLQNRHLIRCNSALAAMFGYRVDELVGVSASMLHISPEAFASKGAQAYRDVAERGTHAIDTQHKRKDGSVFWVNTVLTALDRHDLSKGVIWVAQDIDQRKRAELALRLNERAMDACSNGIIITDCGQPDNPIIYVNAAFERITGYSVQEVMGRNARFLIGSDREQAGVQEYRRAVCEQREATFEMRNYRKDGSPFWDEVSIAPVRDETGQITHFVGILEEITERKLAEEALRESEARFRALTELSSDYYWESDSEHRFTRYVAGAHHKSALPPGSHIGKARWEVPYVTPDEAGWRAHRQILEAHQPFRDFELSRMREDGSAAHFSISGEPILDQHGRFLGYRGIGREVTARVRAEQELRRFRTAMDLSEDSIVLVSRASMQIVDANAGACRMLGYTRDELLAMRPSKLSVRALQEIERTYDEVIAHGEVGVVNGKVRRKDGTLVPVEVLRRALRSGKDWIVVSISRDISERLAAEKEIRDHINRQELVADFGQHALANSNLDELLQEAVNLVAYGLNIDLCKLLQLTPDRSAFALKSAAGWDREWIGRSIVEATAASHAGFALSSREPVAVADFRRETRFTLTPLAAAHRARSALAVPIIGASGPYGVLAVHSRRLRTFSVQDVNFLQAIANILATAVERKNAEGILAHLAQFDALTGLPNRHLLHDRLTQMLVQAQRANGRIGCMFVDLDRFKFVNDTFGHNVGDKLLVQVAQRLQQCVRSGDTVGRLGGDEFALALSNLAKADDVGLVAQKVIGALAAPYDLDGRETYVSASIGIAMYPGDAKDAAALLRNADIAMYRAKEQGRNNYQFYLPEMNARTLNRLQTETRLRGALERNEFLLHYQPKVDLATGLISGFEALLRWQHPDDGLVSPAHFVPVLEDTGLIVPVGEWVLSSVCRQIRFWQEQAIKPRPIAVNLSARQFQHKDLDAVIARIMHETGINPAMLELELTESLLMSDAEESVRTLKNLKASGVRLSVDDFGTGYSSLAYLKRFPLDALKIDRAFIRDATVDPDDAAIALAIISLAHSLKLKVVAEGVETAAQLKFLRDHGCDEMQGYYFARPQSIEDCTRALVEDRRLQIPLDD